jgi:hypothetical protein
MSPFRSYIVPREYQTPLALDATFMMAIALTIAGPGLLTIRPSILHRLLGTVHFCPQRSHQIPQVDVILFPMVVKLRD